MKFLVADDHDLVLEGLRVILARLGPDIDIMTCSNFADALEAAAVGDAFDLVVLDLDMPGMNGAVGIEVFRSYFPQPALVALSEQPRREVAVAALRYGAAGFVPKSLKAEAMLHAFQLVLAGERFVPASLMSDGLAESGGLVAKDGGEADSALQRLTGREGDVLKQLLDGLTNKEIGRHLDVREVTVKLHLRSVYRKLGVKNRAQAVKMAFVAGWPQ